MAIPSVISHSASAPPAADRFANLTWSVRRVTWGLVSAAALLIGLHLLSEAVAELWGEPEQLRYFFSLRGEANPGALYSTLQLLFCAMLLTAITRSELGGRHRWYWGILAAGFYYLALDEGARIHELLSPLVQTMTGRSSGITRQGWVIPGIAVVAVVGLSYLRFIFLLPRRTALQFAIGGAIYVSGLIGVEILSSLYMEALRAVEGSSCNLTRDCGFGHSVMIAVEEGMEMIGITIFANALMHTCLTACPKVCIRLDR
ncbi:MAG: hypothetical protein ACREEP_15215 [Dongiaceae bacterium]